MQLALHSPERLADSSEAPRNYIKSTYPNFLFACSKLTDHTAAVKSLLTVMTLLQQKSDCGRYAQRKWRSDQPVLAHEHAELLL